MPKGFKNFGFRIGKPVINYGITTGVYAIGLITKNEKIRKTGVLLIASATAGGLIQSITKTLAGRARPGSGKNPNFFKPFSPEAAFHSFPSGHTILAFTTAHAIAKQFKNPWVKGGIYTIGMISPISRLSNGAHWLTDVGLGIALSIAVVDGVDNLLRAEKRYNYDPKKLSIRWDMSFGPGQLGVVGKF